MATQGLRQLGNMRGQQLRNVADPTQDMDAVNRRYFGKGDNRTSFEEDGTMVANGDATTWNDINLSALSLRIGATAPTLKAINGTTIYGLAFSGTGPTEEVFGSLEILHDYKEGSTIYPHIHWFPSTTAIGNIKWNMDYMWINRGGVMTGAATLSQTVTTSGVAWQMEFTNFAPSGLSGLGKTMGGRFVFRIYRNAADAVDTYGADAFISDFGLHVCSDTLGSRTVTTK